MDGARKDVRKIHRAWCNCLPQIITIFSSSNPASYTFLPQLSGPCVSSTLIIWICIVHHVITVCGHVHPHIALDFIQPRRVIVSRNKRTLVFPSPFFVGSSLTLLGMSSAKHMASPLSAGCGKCKRVMLTISHKLEICDLVTS